MVLGPIEAKHRPESATPDFLRIAKLLDQLRSVSSTKLNVTIDKALVARLYAYCEKKDVTVDSAATIALDHYLKTRPRP